MKIHYGEKQLQVLQVVQEVFGKFDKMPPALGVYLQHTLITDEHKEFFMKTKKALYGELGWSYFTLHADMEGVELHFRLSRYFGNRQELLDYCKQYDIELPKTAVKEASLSDGKMRTCVTYTVEDETNLLTLYYYRDGAPTTKCRVVTKEVQEVVCDIDNAESEVPF